MKNLTTTPNAISFYDAIRDIENAIDKTTSSFIDINENQINIFISKQEYDEQINKYTPDTRYRIFKTLLPDASDNLQYNYTHSNNIDHVEPHIINNYPDTNFIISEHTTGNIGPDGTIVFNSNISDSNIINNYQYIK
jgi:hypothetical protein